LALKLRLQPTVFDFKNTCGDCSQSEGKVKGVFKRGLTALFSWCKVLAKWFCLTGNNPDSPTFRGDIVFGPSFTTSRNLKILCLP